MSRLRIAVLAVLVVELAVGGWLAVRARTRPVPPAVDLSSLDPRAGDHLRSLTAGCHSTDDWAALGTAYMAFGFYPEAEACHRTAAALAPDLAEFQHQHGFALERLGRTGEANDAYRRAIERGHPEPDGVWYFIGRNALRSEDATAACAAFAEAGNHPSARYELARLAVRQGRTAEATTALDRLMSEFPDAVQPPTLRHRLALGDPSAAGFADRADRAPGRLSTPFDREWNRLEAVFAAHSRTADWKECRQLLESNRSALAEARVRVMLGIDWSPEGAELLADALLRQRQPDAAVGVLEDALGRAGPSSGLLALLGDAHIAADRPAAAATAWRRAVDVGVGRDGPGVHSNLATYCQQTNDPDGAKAHAARARLAVGHELFWQGRYEAARGPLEEATRLDPKLAAAWFYRGEADRLTGRAEAARAALRQCLSLDPHHGRAAAALSGR